MKTTQDTNRNSLFAKTLIAERAYELELDRIYGKDACDARYDRKRNECTPKLKRLATVWQEMMDALLTQTKQA